MSKRRLDAPPANGKKTSFLPNPHRTKPRRAIQVTIGSLSLATVVAFAVPWLNEYFELQRDAAEIQELESELVLSQQRQTMLNKVEQKLASELDDLADRSVDPSNIESVREQLIEIVRASKARLRRLEISPPETRRWAIEGDDARNEAMPIYGEESQFELHSHNIELQADGSLEAVRQILKQVTQQGWLMTTKTMLVSPSGSRVSPMNLELRTVVYGMTAAANPSDEDLDPEELASHVGPIRTR